MKSSKLLYILFFLLLISAVLLVFKDKSGTISKKEKNFNIRVKDRITKVLVKYDSTELIIDKESGIWKVNHTFPAKEEAVTLLSNSLMRLEILSPVPRNYRVLAAQKLRNYSKKVDVYAEKRLLKSFYVRYDSGTLNATMMMMADAKTPYIVKLKGYDIKNISKIFSTDVRFWRNNTLFNYTPEELKSVVISYAETPSSSFAVCRLPDSRWQLISLSTNKDVSNVADMRSIHDYMFFFSNVKFSYPAHPVAPETLNEKKFADITISDTDERRLRISLFRKPLIAGGRNTSQYDLNTCYGTINDEVEPVEIRYFDIDPVLAELDDFLKK